MTRATNPDAGTKTNWVAVRAVLRRDLGAVTRSKALWSGSLPL